MRLALSKEGRESGIWSAVVNCTLHSSCDICGSGLPGPLLSPKHAGRGNSEMLYLSCLWSFFPPREKSNAAVFQVFVFVMSVPR